MLKSADGKPAREFRSSYSLARMFSNILNQWKRIKVIQRDVKLYHFIPYVFIFRSIHLSPAWLLLAKKIDSDFKAKMGFIRSVWGGRSSRGCRETAELCSEQRRTLQVRRWQEPSAQTPGAVADTSRP